MSDAAAGYLRQLVEQERQVLSTLVEGELQLLADAARQRQGADIVRERIAAYVKAAELLAQ